MAPSVQKCQQRARCQQNAPLQLASRLSATPGRSQRNTPASLSCAPCVPVVWKRPARAPGAEGAEGAGGWDGRRHRRRRAWGEWPRRNFGRAEILDWSKFSAGASGPQGSPSRTQKFWAGLKFWRGAHGALAMGSPSHSPKFVLLCSLCSCSMEEASQSYTGVDGTKGAEGRDGRRRRRWSWSRSPRMG